MTADSVLQNEKFRMTLSDRINPIVIKELRQAVQSRFVSAALMALLMIQLGAMGIYLLTTGGELLDFNSGRTVFMLLFAILLGIGMLFVPLYTAARLAAERSDTNVDLLFITTIKPRSIIAGKMLSAMVLAVLIFSACMPFMTFTYFLRGIDLPAIFISLGFAFLVVIACTQAAVLVASLPINRAFKVIIGIITLVLYLVAYISTITWVESVTRGRFRSGTGRSEFWMEVAVLLIIIGFLGTLFFMLSIALIKPVAANRALPVRLFITIAWIVIGSAAVIDSAIEKEHGPVTAWNILFNILFATSLFVAVSEREGYGRRLMGSIPHSPIKRIACFPFFSGAANGVIWAMAMILLTLAAVWVWAKSLPSHGGLGGLVDSAKWMGGMSLYFFCYAMSASLLRRHLLKRIPQEFTWLIGAIMLALGGTAPILVGYLLFFNDQWESSDFGRWFVGNPFAWDYKGNRVFFASVGGVWAVLAAAMSLHWMIDHYKHFRPASRDERILS